MVWSDLVTSRDWEGGEAGQLRFDVGMILKKVPGIGKKWSRKVLRIGTHLDRRGAGMKILVATKWLVEQLLLRRSRVLLLRLPRLRYGGHLVGGCRPVSVAGRGGEPRGGHRVHPAVLAGRLSGPAGRLSQPRMVTNVAQFHTL